MKILYLTTELNRRNGWGTVSYYTAKCARESGHDVEVVTGLAALNEGLSGVPCHRLLTSQQDGYLKTARILRDVMNIRSHFDIRSCDVVHVLAEPYLPLVSLLSHERLFVTLHGTYAVLPFEKGRNRWLYRFSAKKLRHAFAVSAYTADRFAAVCSGVPVTAMPLGVDTQQFSCAAISDGQQKENAFCFVGGFKPRKGLLLAIKAIEKLRDACPDICLYVVGGQETFDEYVQECQDYVSRNGLEKNIRSMGFLSMSELKDCYAKSLANVLPSINIKHYFEGFGLIHLEANAMGVPSIGSKGCGNESAIQEGINGFLCDQRDVDALTDRMQYFLSIKGTPAYQEFCVRAQAHAYKNNWNHTMQPIIESYGH